MEQHYREHVIVYDTCQDSKTQLWLGSATVRFAEGARVHVVPVPEPFELCKTKDEAQEKIISVTRGWIDSRLNLSRGSTLGLSGPHLICRQKRQRRGGQSENNQNKDLTTIRQIMS